MLSVIGQVDAPVIRVRWDWTSYGPGWSLTIGGRYRASNAEPRLCYPDQVPRRLGEAMAVTLGRGSDVLLEIANGGAS